MKKEKPLVTIGIPTYNRAGSYLRPALESALKQTYPNLEIIVSDNCSPDRTRDLVEGFGDERIRYYRHDPAVKPHRNADFCLAEAKGEFFQLLHDDDLIDPDFIARCVEALEGKEVGFVRTGARVIDARGGVMKSRPNRDFGNDFFAFCDNVLKGGAVTYFCNTLYRTADLREVGGFRSKGHAYHDILTNIKLASARGWIDLEEPLASYRIHGSKMGGATHIGKWCEDSIAIVNLMCELLPEHKEYFMKEGMDRMCRRNFTKADRMMNMPMKLQAFAIIARKYRFRHVPYRFVMSRFIPAAFSGGASRG